MAKASWHQKFKRSSKERRTNAAGITFDSVGEMERYARLQQWLLAGEIRNLRRQVSFPLENAHTKVLTPTGRVMKYTADFVYDKRGVIDLQPGAANHAWEEVIEDFKGHMGRVEELRIAIFEALYKKKIHIVKK